MQDMYIIAIMVILVFTLSFSSTYYERKKRKTIFIRDKNFDLAQVYNYHFKDKEITYEEFKWAWDLTAKTLHLDVSQINYNDKLSSYHTKFSLSIESDIDDFVYFLGDEVFDYEDENGIIDLSIEELIILMIVNKRNEEKDK